MSGVEVRDKRFEGVVGKSVEFERLATGFIFTEGPLWHRRDKYLLFSDMPGDHLRRWSAEGRRHHLPQALQQVERARLGPAGAADRLRARLEPPHAHGARRQDHGARQPSRRQGAEQPQRRGREERRRHLLLRPHLRAQAALRRAARAAAFLPRRLSPRARRQDAHAARRRFRPAERAVLLARREGAVRQRHGQAAHPRLRREGGRHARQQPRLGEDGRRGRRARPTA